MRKTLSVAAAVVLAAGSMGMAQTHSLTTTWVSGGTYVYAPNSGQLFDVTAFDLDGITLESIDVRVRAPQDVPATIEIYYRQGSYVGHEHDASEWTRLGRATVPAGGPSNPDLTAVPIGGLPISYGETFGIYVNHVGGGTMYNTDANFVPAIHSNDHLRIETGHVNFDLFSLPQSNAAHLGFYLRLHYTLGSTPATGGCCLSDGSCIITSEALCEGQWGSYRGDGSTCASPCDPPGICCFAWNQSCNTIGEVECVGRGGTFLGAGATCADCPAPPPGSVAILAALPATVSTSVVLNPRHAELDVRPQLLATGLIPEAVIFDVAEGTPTLADLEPFAAVLLVTWHGRDFHNAWALGDVLADYVDAGGGVVNTISSVATTTANRFLAGRWGPDYQIVPLAGSVTSWPFGAPAPALGTVLLPNHPIMEGVSTFAIATGSEARRRPNTLDLTPHGVKVAEWNDTEGRTLIAVSNTLPRRVDLGFRPVSNASFEGGYSVLSDASRIIANALVYAGAGTPACYANCDGSTADPVLNVEDFVCFINAFAAASLLTPAEQLTHYANCDGSTAEPILNVEDFICFINEFAAGCP
jgi:hypothetical protein